jgi:hypothetical protein
MPTIQLEKKLKLRRSLANLAISGNQTENQSKTGRNRGNH